MNKRDKLIICRTCGEVNDVENVSCKSCLGDLTGDPGVHSGQSQLAHIYRLVRLAEGTNRRLAFLTASLWLIFALFVAWTVVAGIMDVGGPGTLFHWPF